jgi:Rrf2 family protein
MKISAQEEYGLRCLLQLAFLENGESLTLPQIADREGISTANAGKLLWILNKAGFVQATRGTKGGYSLSRPANEIYLNQVIKVLEEPRIAKATRAFSKLVSTKAIAESGR